VQWKKGVGVSHYAVFFLLVISPMLAMLLALLGIETIPTNPLGWFLLLVGVINSAGGDHRQFHSFGLPLFFCHLAAQ